MTIHKVEGNADSRSGSTRTPPSKELALLLASTIVGLLLCEFGLRAILPWGCL
jgi:hypothetical protein